MENQVKSINKTPENNPILYFDATGSIKQLNLFCIKNGVKK